MTNKNLALMALPVLATIMIVGALAPAFAANIVNDQFNGKNVFVVDGDVLLVAVENHSTSKGNPAEHESSILIFDGNTGCFDSFELESNQLRWSQGRAELNITDSSCGEIHLTFVGQGPVEKTNEKFTGGDPTCNDFYVSFSINGQVRDASVSGSIGANDYADLSGGITHGESTLSECEPSSP